MYLHIYEYANCTHSEIRNTSQQSKLENKDIVILITRNIFILKYLFFGFE